MLVTGSAGGIGRALAKRFAREDFQVIGLDCCSAPNADQFPFIQADLVRFCRESNYRSETLARIRGELPDGRLDVLVNNAALQVVSAVETLTTDEWFRVMDVNVSAPFFLVQGLLTELQRASGTVINIASIHAQLTKPGFSAYASSKAALSGLTRALAVELGGKIRVNAIAPAAISTPMLEDGLRGSPGSRQLLEDFHPVHRIGSPEEVAELTFAIASGDMPFLNGAVIQLDGGIGARLHDPL